MKFHYLSFLALPLLVSCASLPKDVAELTQSRLKSDVVCHNEPFTLIVERVDAFLTRCYSPKKFRGAMYAAGIFVVRTVDVNWEVNESPIENGTRFVVQTEWGYALAADVKRGEATCPTVTQYYAAQGPWARRFSLLDQATQGDKPACGYE